MPHVLSSDNNEPDDLGPIAVTVTVPEEFLGFSVGALAARQGYLNGIYNQHGQAVIEASLPASQFEALQKAIIEYAGADRCSVKLADGLAETDNPATDHWLSAPAPVQARQGLNSGAGFGFRGT